MEKILTYGTFDLLHEGHLRLLHRASKLGELYVGVSTDDFCREKGKETVVDELTRLRTVERLPFVNTAFYEFGWYQKQDDINYYKIDTLVMGDDWSGQFDYLNVKSLYLPRTPEISTSYLKEIFSE